MQIAAVSARQPEAWQATAAVSLVSSFCASLLRGGLVPMDCSDARGTLLMDLGSRTWSDGMLTCGAFPVDLKGKLGGEPVAPHTVVGRVSELVRARWGLPDDCRVVASSGDNPCAIAGLGLAQPGDLALSLGTSDTLLGVARAADATPALEGHVMAHPCDPDAVFGMLCYKNGGAARQRVRDERCDGSWERFDEAVAAAPPGNDGVLGLHLPLPEITPIIPRAGVWHLNGDGALVAPSGVSDAEAARAVVEGRFLSMRGRGGALGLKGARRILATGGGSQSTAILQIAADVFNAPVLQADSPDAAAVGAARRAAHALALEALGLGGGDGGGAPIDRLPYSAYLEAAMEGGADAGLEVVATPRADAAAVYSDALVDRYREFEDMIARGGEEQRSGAAATDAGGSAEPRALLGVGPPAPAGFEWGATY